MPDETIERMMPSDPQFYMPILRVDREKREIIARATAEAMDGYGTVFSFDGSKEAFGKWRGNIREMHDPTKAVGKALRWDPVPDEKAIDVVLRVSKGAEDTWQKVLDGTLSGLSVGAKNGVWSKKAFNGQEVPFLERYDLVELSLVDNPATPGCDIKIVRADGIATEVIDQEPDESEVETPVEPTLPLDEVRTEVPDETRAGATISADTRAKLHQVRDMTISTCGCDECSSMASGSAGGDGSGEDRALQTEIYRICAERMSEIISRNITPVVTRMNGIASRFAQVDTHQQQPDITRRLDAIESKLNEQSELRSLLSEVKGIVDKIALQPQSGGPIINSAVMRANQPQDQSAMEQRLIESLSQAGILNKDQQINAALRLMQGK